MSSIISCRVPPCSCSCSCLDVWDFLDWPGPSLGPWLLILNVVMYDWMRAPATATAILPLAYLAPPSPTCF